jgi:hypothetical protein
MHSKSHLLTHSILWNAEDCLNPLHARTSATLCKNQQAVAQKVNNNYKRELSVHDKKQEVIKVS